MSQTIDAPNSVAGEPLSVTASPRRFVLSGLSWETYELLRADLDRAGCQLKLTFANGDLEFEVPTDLHEALKEFFGAIIQAFLFDRRTRFAPLAGTTWKRRLMEQGLEADVCYYVQNVAAVGKGLQIDLERDPVPDLAVEVEVTSPLLPKLPIYAALGIPEIWHIRAPDGAQVLRLEDGKYIPVMASVSIPFFTRDVIRRQLALRLAMDHFDAVERFRDEITRR